jgi:L-fucose mutarotase/ribose pyranase (RbsD/FucU family)
MQTRSLDISEDIDMPVDATRDKSQKTQQGKKRPKNGAKVDTPVSAEGMDKPIKVDNVKAKKMDNDAKPVFKKKSPVKQQPRPVLYRPIQLGSMHALRIYKRTYNQASRDMFYIAIMSDNLIEQPEQVDELLEGVENMLQSVARDLENEMERAQHQLNEYDINQMASYTKVTEFNAPINCAEIRQYLDLIVTMDRLILMIDTLWLNGIVTTRGRKQRSYEWQSRMLNTANRLRGIADKLRHVKNEMNENAHSKPSADIKELGFSSVILPG